MCNVLAIVPGPVVSGWAIDNNQHLHSCGVIHTNSEEIGDLLSSYLIDLAVLESRPLYRRVWRKDKKYHQAQCLWQNCLSARAIVGYEQVHAQCPAAELFVGSRYFKPVLNDEDRAAVHLDNLSIDELPYVFDAISLLMNHFGRI